MDIARPDHWFKNIFMVPGVLLFAYFHPGSLSWAQLPGLLIGLAAACLVASSNFIINEVLDAPCDKLHPVKKNRPVPSGQVKIPVA